VLPWGAVRMTSAINPSAGLLVASLWLTAPLAFAATDAPTLPPHFAGSALDEAPTALTADWWTAYASDELSTLLAAGARDNLDIQAAIARLQAASARARAAHASVLPTVDAGLGATHYAGHSNAGTAQETDAGVLLSASYELDFFGKNRAIADSAGAQAAVSRAERDTVVLATQAALAAGYFTVVSLRERLHWAEVDLTTAQRILTLVEARHAAQAVGDAELANERNRVAAATLTVVDLTAQEAVARESLAVLAGRDPEGFGVTATDLGGLQLPSVVPDLPATLLQRRPDIQAAQAQLHAATAQVGVATAALLPQITLGAFAGPQALTYQDMFKGSNETWGVSFGLLQPIFHGGALRAQKRGAEAGVDQALADYRQTVLVAFANVSDALNALRFDAQTLQAQVESEQAAARSLDLAKAQFRIGAASYLQLLDATRSWHLARMGLIRARATSLSDTTALYAALGGGF